MFEIRDGVLIKYTGKDKTVVIPDEVTRIGNSAFSYCGKLESITIPESVMWIDDYAFLCCTNLKNITIPGNVIRIGACAFYECSGLKSITIPDSVNYIDDSAFAFCAKLKNITIGNGVKSIGQWTFDGCKELANITLGNSVTNVGVRTFYLCPKLKTKKSIYKAFDLENNKLDCRGYEFKENEWSDEIKNVAMCDKGYHYCENLFDIFNYYFGSIDKDIAIYECEARGISEATHFDSKKVCQQIKPVRRLYRKDVIKILNGGKNI